MSTYLVVKDDLVINTVVWDGESEWSAPEGSTLEIAPVNVGVGWVRVDGEWIAPTPAPLTQAELAKISAREKLVALGLTESEINALLGS